MDKVVQYRERAEAVERMAEAVASDGEREHLMAVARTWRGLAERAEISDAMMGLAARWRGLTH